MKANELMIGDWVSYGGTPIKVENVHEDCINFQHDIPFVQEEFLIEQTEVESIPLTPEILEKNGFEKVYDKYKLPNYRIKWNNYTNFYFTVFTGVDSYWNPIDLNVITGGVPATIDYVHQLQHALRLCGIKKEIVL